MNTKKIFRLIVALCIIVPIITGCSDEFLQDKRNYQQTDDGIYNDYEGTKARVDNIYALILPKSTEKITYETPSAGTNDDHAKSTEEYGGLSKYVDTDTPQTASNVDDFFYNEQKMSRNPYGRIRNCNDLIEGIANGTLLKEQKEKAEELLGQVHFFRAWMYLHLVKIYGGVPLVKEAQNIVVGDDGGLTLSIPRSTTKECIDFIAEDLRLAAEYLPAKWDDGNYGRVTSGAALALQGRARLLYASPLFNRGDDKARWELAYQSNKAARDELTIGGFGLAYLNKPGNNAEGWAKMFSDYVSPEAVFVTLYNSVKSSPGISPDKNNGWENSIRPKNATGSGGRVPTDMIIDLFPMASGAKPTASNYNKNLFMLDRDPRFYRTFAFPGVRWAFSGDPTSLNATSYPYVGANYELWNYAWYETKEMLESTSKSGFGADGLGIDYKGLYIRKRTDDYDVNTSALYQYDLKNEHPFRWSAAPYMEIRYAEVLLNLAEAACGAGHLAEGVEALKLIRQRVGYMAADNFGLPTLTDRAKLFEAILYERQVELAYEGKRFDDMRRWMLWDGGANQASISPTWTVTGFGGNTCTYLGVAPLNGKRRDGIELRVADVINNGLGAQNNASDPLKTLRPAAWNLTKSATISPELEEFYRTKLTRKTRQSDSSVRTVTFQPQYYFIGLKESAQKNNITLAQTIGWTDIMKNAPGTFDPIAE